MNPDLIIVTIASRSALRSDSNYFAWRLSLLAVAAWRADHFPTTGLQMPENPRQHASLAPLNCPHLRLHALPMRLLRIQSP
jgi:hypothetical protein